MKKIIASCVLVMGAGLSGSALAVGTPVPFEGGHLVTAGTGMECALLSEEVNLTTSANVVGAFSCDEITGIVKVAACHKGGSREGIQCTLVPEIVDGVATGNFVPNSQTCSVEEATQNQQSKIPAYSVFVASSSGGTIYAKDLDGRCGTDTIVGIGYWTE